MCVRVCDCIVCDRARVYVFAHSLAALVLVFRIAYLRQRSLPLPPVLSALSLGYHSAGHRLVFRQVFLCSRCCAFAIWLLMSCVCRFLFELVLLCRKWGIMVAGVLMRDAFWALVVSLIMFAASWALIVHWKPFATHGSQFDARLVQVMMLLLQVLNGPLHDCMRCACRRCDCVFVVTV